MLVSPVQIAETNSYKRAKVESEHAFRRWMAPKSSCLWIESIYTCIQCSYQCDSFLLLLLCIGFDYKPPQSWRLRKTSTFPKLFLEYVKVKRSDSAPAHPPAWHPWGSSLVGEQAGQSLIHWDFKGIFFTGCTSSLKMLQGKGEKFYLCWVKSPSWIVMVWVLQENFSITSVDFASNYMLPISLLPSPSQSPKPTSSSSSAFITSFQIFLSCCKCGYQNNSPVGVQSAPRGTLHLRAPYNTTSAVSSIPLNNF